MARKSLWYDDWELAWSVSALIWACVGMDISRRVKRFATKGHEYRFFLSPCRDFARDTMRNALEDIEAVKKRLFEIPEETRKSLRKAPAEQRRRRLADSKCGMASKLIYMTLLPEPDGAQGYLVFRCKRSNKCIVCLLS